MSQEIIDEVIGLSKKVEMNNIEQNLFMEDMERTAIERIVKFSRICAAFGFEPVLGFSGGKDSQVVYDLCKRAGIAFKACFNHAFESPETLTFIRRNYPEVTFRRNHKFGFIENIAKNHCGMLPTVQKAYCCEDYKHNPKYADSASITGVRKAESVARRSRTTLSVKNKTTRRKHKQLFDAYFSEHCQSEGTASVIQLMPIIDWSEGDVWSYIRLHSLPVNPEYEHCKRVGCMVCPKANFSSNYRTLLRYPKLIDAFIKAKSAAKNCDWMITSDNADYAADKCLYICRWLNHSFMPFTKKQQKQYKLVKQEYNKIHNKR